MRRYDGSLIRLIRREPRLERVKLRPGPGQRLVVAPERLDLAALGQRLFIYAWLEGPVDQGRAHGYARRYALAFKLHQLTSLMSRASSAAIPLATAAAPASSSSDGPA